MLAPLLLAFLGQGFTIHPLEVSPGYVIDAPWSISNSGEACGSVWTHTHQTACSWDAQGRLTVFNPTQISVTNCINDYGLVVGSVGFNPKPFLWPSGYQLWTAGWGAGINNHNDILLQAGTTGILLPRTGGQVFFPVDGYLRALDDTGAACGWRQALAFRWHQSVFQDLLPAAGFTGSQAFDLVPGTVVGVSYTDVAEQATTWDSAGLPTLLPTLLQGSDHSVARACNTQGWVIGWEWSSLRNDQEMWPMAKAVLWINGVPEELPLAGAFDLNDRAQIVGLGFDGKPVRLDPN